MSFIEFLKFACQLPLVQFLELQFAISYMVINFMIGSIIRKTNREDKMMEKLGFTVIFLMILLVLSLPTIAMLIVSSIFHF